MKQMESSRESTVNGNTTDGKRTSIERKHRKQHFQVAFRENTIEDKHEFT